MQEVWRDLPHAVSATRNIAERCEFTLKDLGYRFPGYPLQPVKHPTAISVRSLTVARASDGAVNSIATNGFADKWSTSLR